jgi:hypothetical protein
MITNYDSIKTSGPSDCGLCVLSGITGIEKQTLVDKYRCKWEGMDYDRLFAACWCLYADDHLTWIVNELPKEAKYNNPAHYVFGKPSWENFLSWAEHAERHLNAGCLGIAQVHMHGNAMGDRKHQFYINHWVMINGINYKGFEPGERVVHISCSVRGRYSVGILEFLMNYGGYNAIWVRPKNNS